MHIFGVAHFEIALCANALAKGADAWSAASENVARRSIAEAADGPGGGRTSMTTQRRLRPPEYFFYLQYHVVKQRELMLGDVLASLGLTIPKWRILSVLNRLGESSMGLVADFCAIDRTTLTRTMDQLVAAGLVRRREHPSDRRQMLMSLTPAGDRSYASAVVAVVAFNEKALQGVEPEEMHVLERLLSKVVRNVIDDGAWAQSILDFEHHD